MEEETPDIILADICMPVVDGLKFAKQVRQQNPEIQIIFLTGHDKFSYANDSIKIGVFDYLLKPVDAGELLETLSRARMKIEKERRHDEEFCRLKDEIMRERQTIFNRCIYELCRGSDTKSVLNELEYLNFHLNEECYQIAVIGLYSAKEGQMEAVENQLLYHARAYELVQMFFKDMAGIYVIQGDMQLTVILNNQKQISFEEECECLLKYISGALQCKIFIGVGNAFQTMEDIKISYREASDSLKYYYMRGESEVIYFKNIVPSNEGMLYIDQEAINSFSFYLRSGFADKAKEVVAELFGNMKKEYAQREHVVLLTVRLAAEIETILFNLGLTDVLNDNLIKNMMYFESIGETEDYLNILVDASAEKIVQLIRTKEKSLIGDTCAYIDLHYTEEDLTLAQIAEKLYTNASYLSRLLKEKTGMTFRGYLFELRMEKAMELLRTTDSKGYEVAEMVGIKDPHYFSKCFKKYAGVSVGDYKRGTF